MTRRFLYDGDALVAEYDGATNAMLRRHVHNVGADVPMVTYVGSDLGTPRQLLADHQGSIVALADASGAAIQINRYDEYGIPGAGNDGTFQYTGQIWLPELGMYHYKARIYSPTLGRFMQTDPIGYEDQFNLYAYVRNDPVNAIDPTGLADINMANRYDFPIVEQFGRRFDMPGVYTVFSHGPWVAARTGYGQRAFNVLEPRALAQRIRSDPGYRSGMPIALLGCRLGSDRRTVEFARLIGSPVIAATSQTHPTLDADGWYSLRAYWHSNSNDPGAFVPFNGTWADFGINVRDGWSVQALSYNPDSHRLRVTTMQDSDSGSRIRRTETTEKPYGK